MAGKGCAALEACRPAVGVGLTFDNEDRLFAPTLGCAANNDICSPGKSRGY